MRYSNTSHFSDSGSSSYPGFRTLAGLAMGLGYYLVCRATIPTGGFDFMDSPLYGWGWVVLPAVAFVLARAIGEWGAVWAVVLLLPQAMAVIVEHDLLSRPGGIHLGTRAMYLVLTHALVTAGVGALGLSSIRRSAAG